MEQLKTYIHEAQQSGQTNEQIRQSLINSGWTEEQIVFAFREAEVATTAKNSVTPTINKRIFNRLTVVLVCLAIVLIASGSAYVLFGRKSNYQATIQAFITATQNKNKSGADSLESAALKTYGKSTLGNASFYDTCQQEGQLCTPFFTASFLGKATKTYKDYTAQNGTKGKKIIYVLKQSLASNQAGGQGCGESTNTLTIAAIPKGNSWLIDYVDPSISVDASLCSQDTQSSATSPSNSTSQPISTTTPTKITQPTTSSTNSSSPQEPPTGKVTISSDGCSVTGSGEVGLRFSIIVTKASGNGGGESDYFIPSSGELTEYSGGYQNQKILGEILNPDGTVNSSAISTITAVSCPPGDPSQ